MKVRSIMTAEAAVISITPTDTIARAAEKLVQHEIGALPVVDAGNQPVGLLAERDIARAVHEHGGATANIPVQRVMQRPAPTCDADDEIRDVMARMTRKRLRHLVVFDNRRLVGMLSVGDLLKNRLEQLETETGVLRDYVAGQRGRG